MPRFTARHPLRVLGVGLALALGVAAVPAQAEPDAEPKVRIFAAASLTDALNTAIERFEAGHDVDVVPVYASSSTAARQVARGAPADLYFSANEQWMDWLGEQGIELAERADLLQNRLSLIAADDETASFTPGDGTPLSELLADGERLSVGDPDHVPAGIYTRQALESLGEWEALAPRLARADNVRAALALVERGEAPRGIVYRTDALASDRVHELGLFPLDSHPAIRYPVALIDPPADGAAEAFRAWLGSDEAMDVFARFGFEAAGAER
ncbi:MULTISPECIES: molybdate ABC transporter substrate-binding protein [Halomonas]|uniref:Molybdate ABC transporter substrate-binding protein n=1 Tax=Halomonas halophila TaxID=29573 RepID=A0ABQ0U3J4_9GAMM|nr:MULTISPECIES: molybdate ABC transporter substrate-binding protein [Halomonas]MDR5888487.1 molybdate ABC transporter substrate-binding protein [Halomonas salina]WJY07670.1 molybdate ABC transporter substrate-binding protein [Halomonas halophila]GEK73046.1 molybdate ABC transporter substrate-binding protein [Halomonas halophila]